MKNSVYFLFMIVIYNANLHDAVGQQAVGCGVDLSGHYYVNETDPPRTEIFRINASSVTWTMSVDYAAMPDFTSGVLDPYVILQRQTSGDYILTVNKMMDLEAMKNTLGAVPSSLTLKLNCVDPQHGPVDHEVVVVITPVNEYFPEFFDSPYNFSISENVAVRTSLIKLSDHARDLDVRPGENDISTYRIVQYSGKPGEDGRDYFNMDPPTGLITVGKHIDFEELYRVNRTTMWLNVTVIDLSGNVNWTTVRVTVKDEDDQTPEFYVASVCGSANIPRPDPCPITYKVKVLINTTGIANQIEPAVIFAHDRDTIGNSILYSLEDSAGAGGIMTHFLLDQTTGVLTVVQPFFDTGVFSLYVVAKEDSAKGSTAQATLQVDVYSADYDPWDAVSSDAPTAHPHNTKGEEGDKNNDSIVSVIGIAVLGVICLGLIIALFITCYKLRVQRKGRVGSADTTHSSRKPFVDDEELPSSSGPSPVMKKQEAVLSKLPKGGQRGNQLPPLPNDVFDGTKKFQDTLSPDFFTAPGKVKVPLMPTADSKTQGEQPIIIDDNRSSSP